MPPSNKNKNPTEVENTLTSTTCLKSMSKVKYWSGDAAGSQKVKMSRGEGDKVHGLPHTGGTKRAVETEENDEKPREVIEMPVVVAQDQTQFVTVKPEAGD